MKKLMNFSDVLGLTSHWRKSFYMIMTSTEMKIDTIQSIGEKCFDIGGILRQVPVKSVLPKNNVWG